MGIVKVKYLQTRSYKGQTLLYWYPKSRYFVNGEWVACPIAGGQVSSLNEALARNNALDKWRRGDDMPSGYPEGTVGWLLGQYKADERFTGLAPATQKLYLNSFKELLTVFGDIPIAKITRLQVRAFYQSFSGTSRKASQVMQNCRVVFQFAKDIEIITDNPFSEQRVAKAKPRQGIVSQEAITAAKHKAYDLGLPSIAMAIQLGCDGGQRPGDIRKLLRNQYNGTWLEVKQSKTGALVSIPVHRLPELKIMMDALKPDSVLILHEERTGKPYTKDMLCRRVREVFKAAGVGVDIQFRDLRRTAVVRLAEAGCDIPEICSFTGHKLSEANEILEVYLPRTKKMAENAAEKLQKSKVKPA